MIAGRGDDLAYFDFRFIFLLKYSHAQV